MPRSLVYIMFLWVLGLPVGSNAQAPFELSGNFEVASFPAFTHADDFDDDGNLDLVTAHFGSTELSILYGNGTGVFAPWQAVAVGVIPHGIASGDFNGDNYPDLVCTTGAEPDVSVTLSDGLGGFLSLQIRSLGALSAGPVVADRTNSPRLRIPS